ncbi:hypothetical protein SBA1_300021 [Candidatus Sulfotelmatobacter kueseliae]|uniref:Uncharacterized protein n=1 Tax=Candidatus Sulfotelmatobacter kueseliae TaxID=2042962 RepID=A0A2U3KLR1_9BACT|nr:hypothetical protein SBA1_300021 [Candidatus Sulfotelmatobacter kueseliae]
MGMAMDTVVATPAAVMPAADFMVGRFAAAAAFTEVVDSTAAPASTVVGSMVAAGSTVEAGSTEVVDPMVAGTAKQASA